MTYWGHMEDLVTRHDLPSLVGLSLEEMKDLVTGFGFESYRAKQLFRQVYLKGITDPLAMADLPKALRHSLLGKTTCLKGEGSAANGDAASSRTEDERDMGEVEAVEAGTPCGVELVAPLRVEQVVSAPDGTDKLVFVTARGCHRVEGVLIRSEKFNPAKVTQCISTQVGCGMGCRFCRTGMDGLTRNLSVGEIVGQVLFARAHLRPGERVSNLVFMGMGEPLANLDAVIEALRILTSDDGFGFSPRRITVSTSGLVGRFHTLLEAVPVSLAISLNSTTQDQRSHAMPGAASIHSIDELIAECARLPLAPRRRITFEYVLMAGFNDTRQDADRLARLLRGLKVKINLIPFNAFPGCEFKEPSDEQVELFGQLVRRHGYTVSVRASRGKGVLGACGQLASKSAGEPPLPTSL